MNFIDNTTPTTDNLRLKPTDYIQMMVSAGIDGNDCRRSEFLYYVESAAMFWDVIFDGKNVIFSDKE